MNNGTTLKDIAEREASIRLDMVEYEGMIAWTAFDTTKKVTPCPYPQGSQLARAWRRGWNKGAN